MTGADRASRRRPIAVIGALAVVIGALAASPVAAQSSRERSHVVRDGDTLARIARRYHVSVADLQRLNHLRGTQVRAGARLRVPSGDGTWRRTRARRATVRAGDTLTRIARRYHVSVEDLQTANHMRGTSVRPGQVLYVPMPGQSGGELYASMREGNPVRAPSEPLELPEDVEASARARADALGLGPTRVGQRLLMEAPDPRWIEAARAG
ncbi:MAG: LysM peptidoglycan-binding domain-containing protein, partial [Sandaracinaceae bacterium]